MSDWTLGAIKARNMEINVLCQNQSCRQFFILITDALIEKVGADFLMDDLPPFPCPACEGETVFRLGFVEAEREEDADEA